MKKMMLLANPHSGKGQVKTALVDIISCFNDAGYIVTVFIPGKDGNNSIQNIAKTYGSEYDIVVAVGGDGTLSETVNGLMKCYQLPAVGYIPMGSTNDFAASLTLLGRPNLEESLSNSLNAKAKLRSVAPEILIFLCHFLNLYH